MNWTSRLLLGNLLVCVGLNAQSAAASNSNQPNQTATISEANHDLNLRAYAELLRSDLRKSKANVMGQVMELDASQAAAFWPIYKQFESEFAKIGDRGVSLVEKYTNNYDQMTNELADRLATDLLMIDQQRNDLKRQYYQKFKKALDPITAA